MPNYFPTLAQTPPYAKLHSKHAQPPSKNTANTMSLNAKNQTMDTNPSTKKLNILHLPLELQKEIFKHSPSSDLISLSLVSKAFREIAAANLYRDFHIIFPDEDDASYDSPTDGLASSLDTFVTSDYDYAQYLKDVCFDTLVGGDKAERAYRQFTYDNSCGKFMSTLFLLTLRRAKALERFKWNIRVELSRPVFQALHRITALQHLHIRLHTGFSLYEPPPPLMPSSEEKPAALGISSSGNHPALIMDPPLLLPALTPTESKSMKGKSGRRKSVVQKKHPSTFSGFRDLKTLCLLDMDTLEYLNEIQECIKNSSRTLRKLKLSFSESLANHSRKAVVEVEEDESDVDDPFPPAPHPTVTIPTTLTPRAVEDEKKAQEVALSQIFGFEPTDPAANNESGGEDEVSGEAASKTFIEDVRYHISRLVTAVHGPGSRQTLQKDVLDALEKATQKYTEAIGDMEKSAAPAVTNGESAGTNATPDAPQPNASENAAADGSPEDAPSLFGSASDPKKKKDTTLIGPTPEDVDVESPEAAETNDWDATESDVQVEEANESVVETTTQDATEPTKPPIESVDPDILANENNDMRKYIRETHGLALRTLELYLIPVKASVISRAIDFKVLTRIALLNVGPQSPFWTLLSKENKSSPLPLCKIFTDNVTTPFLNLVSELKCVTELFMLERNRTRQKVESSTPKTTATKEQIRALALRKHVKTLRRLMIKNENDYSWDMSEKSIMLLCRKAKFLEELAISCGISTIHTLFQNINGLKKLRALHIISFRAEDTCVFVIQELRRFAIDVMSSYPELKLEYIGLGASLARITRTIKTADNKSSGKRKGKGKAVAYNPAFAPIGQGGISSSEDDDDSDEGVECGNKFKLEVSESLRFCEVVGVRIFRKDYMHGRL